MTQSFSCYKVVGVDTYIRPRDNVDIVSYRVDTRVDVGIDPYEIATGTSAIAITGGSVNPFLTQNLYEITVVSGLPGGYSSVMFFMGDLRCIGLWIAFPKYPIRTDYHTSVRTGSQ